MPRMGRISGWLAATALAVGGCRTTAPLPAEAPLIGAAPPTALPAGQPTSLEPDRQALPKANPVADPLPRSAADNTTFRVLSEESCRSLAATHAPFADLLGQEAASPVVPPRKHHACRTPTTSCDPGLSELNALAALEARNQAAADALDRFFQLADAETRGERVRAVVPVLDQLRAVIRKAREEGMRVPVDADEIDRQLAAALGMIGQADLGVALLNIDLKRRIGVAGEAVAERLWPTGPFPFSDATIDVEADVRLALERRPDLRFLRTAFQHLSPETLPTMREVLRARTGAPIASPPATTPKAFAAFLDKVGFATDGSKQAAAARQSELALRRQQLYDLIQVRERQAADEVRAAAATLTAQTRQVALARWKVEQLTSKVADAKKQGPLFELPAQLEVHRARAELSAAVYQWHQARVKLLAAEGVLTEPFADR